MLYSQDAALLHLFLAVVYPAIFLVLVRTALSWRDLFNPLCLVIVMGVIRFGVSGILLIFGADPEVWVFRAMGLQWESLQLGHVLALTSLSGIALGWFLLPGEPGQRRPLRSNLGRGVRDVAVIAMVVGFIGVVLFIAGNVPIDEAVFSGTLRRTTIQPGTGKYFVLSYLLIAGSIILAGYFFSPTVRRGWIGFMPVFVATSSFWILGGRGRAVTALLDALLILWYVGRERRRWPAPSLRLLSALVLIAIPLATWFGYFGQLYRGGQGIQGFQESLSFSELWEYLRYSIFADIGHLHALAGAVSLRPAVMEGTTFFYSLLWPVSQVLQFPGRHPGLFLDEALGGNWRLAPGLAGDTYMNFGSLGIPVVMVVYGLALKALYVKFRSGQLHLAIYVLAVHQVVGMFWGGISIWAYMLVMVAWGVSIIKTAEALSRLKSRPAALTQP